MSTLAPSRLYDVSEAETFLALTNSNFSILAEEVAKRVATYSSGVPNTIIGPPTAGAHVQNEFWRDSLGGEFVCTSAGTPGTWKQMLPAPVTTDPSTGTIPTGYLILNTTLAVVKRHAGSYVWTTRFGDGTNYLDISGTGHVTLSGTATVWDDLLVPITTTKLGGSNDPTFAKVLDNGAGSHGVFGYKFSASTEQEVYFAVQFPHARKDGSDVYAHVHWLPTTTGAGSVVWGLEYSWASIEAVMPSTTIITVADAAAGVANTHQIAGFSAITGTGKTVSSMMLCRLFRKAADGSDTYGDDAVVLAVDFHIEQDKLGDEALYVP